MLLVLLSIIKERLVSCFDSNQWDVKAEWDNDVVEFDAEPLFAIYTFDVYLCLDFGTGYDRNLVRLRMAG